jgi:hypothetical protein
MKAEDGDGVNCAIYYDMGSGPAFGHHNVMWNNANDLFVNSTFQHSPDDLHGYWYNNTCATRVSYYAQSYKSPQTRDVHRNNIYRDEVMLNLGQWTPDVKNSIMQNVDPQFVGTGQGGLAYQLKPTSPAIDAGTVIAGITQTPKPDAGAYEFGLPAWVPGYNTVAPPPIELPDSIPPPDTIPPPIDPPDTIHTPEPPNIMTDTTVTFHANNLSGNYEFTLTIKRIEQPVDSAILPTDSVMIDNPAFTYSEGWTKRDSRPNEYWWLGTAAWSNVAGAFYSYDIVDALGFQIGAEYKQSHGKAVVTVAGKSYEINLFREKESTQPEIVFDTFKEGIVLPSGLNTVTVEVMEQGKYVQVDFIKLFK